MLCNVHVQRVFQPKTNNGVRNGARTRQTPRWWCSEKWCSSMRAYIAAIWLMYICLWQHILIRDVCNLSLKTSSKTQGRRLFWRIQKDIVLPEFMLKCIVFRWSVKAFDLGHSLHFYCWHQQVLLVLLGLGQRHSGGSDWILFCSTPCIEIQSSAATEVVCVCAVQILTRAKIVVFCFWFCICSHRVFVDLAVLRWTHKVHNIPLLQRWGLPLFQKGQFRLLEYVSIFYTTHVWR